MADNDQWLHDADRLDIPGPRKVKRPRVQLDSEKFGQFAEATARFMGTAKFLVYMTVIVCSWVIWNRRLARSPLPRARLAPVH